MRVMELFSSIRNTLQDHDKNYWDDSELLAYYNECKREMSAERLENKTTATLTLDPTKNEYDTTGVLRYISAKDDNDDLRNLYANDRSGELDDKGIVIVDYNKIWVNDPTIGSTIKLHVVALPEEDNLTSNVRVGDENALRYYVLSKAYEKDTDMENFQKSSYFYSKFNEAFKILRDASSANYQTSTVTTTTTTFF